MHPLDPLVPTEQVLARLRAVGLRVSRTMLIEDVRGGYLPHPRPDPRGPGMGIGRMWEPWAVRRAEYMYRLRRRGATGQLLRVLLFLRDGWGWDTVRPLCLSGCRRTVAGEVSRIRRHLRHVTPRGVETIVDDVEPHPVMQQAALFNWGLGLFGKPLPGGSLKPFVAALTGVLGVRFEPADMDEAESMMSRSGANWQQLLDLIEHAETNEVDNARRLLLGQLRDWRTAVRTNARRTGQHMGSTNLLTAFGTSRRELQLSMRTSTGRMTAAQFAAALVGYCLFVLHMVKSRDIANDDA